MTEIYLGRVVQTRRTESDQQLAWLEPLARLDDEGVRLRPLSDNEKGSFLKRGWVIWFNSFPEATYGVHYYFQVRESPSFDPAKPNSDRYTVFNSAFSPEEPGVIVTGLKNGNDLRNRLASNSAGPLISPSRTYAELSPSEIAGPIPFVRDKQGWQLDLDSLDKLPLSVYDYPVSGMLWNSHVLIPPDWDRRGHGRQIDWADPAIVLGRTLDLLKRFDRQYAEDLRFSKSAIDGLVERIEDRPLSPLDQQRLETSQAFLDGVLQDAQKPKKFIRRFADIPSFREPLEAEMAKRKADILQAAMDDAETIRQQARGGIQEAESRKAELEEEINQRQIELEVLEGKIAEANAELVQTVERDTAAVQTALETRLLEIAEQPHAWLADIAVLRAGLGTQLRIGHEPHAATLSRPRLISTVQEAWRERVNPIEDIKEIQRALRPAMTSQDINRMLAATLSGAVPILSGPDSFLAAAAFAQTVAGGRVIRVEIDPSLTTPSHLFLDSRSGKPIVPAAHGLMDALLYAWEHGDDLMVVILEGVNRSAIDLYLLPILQLYGGDRPSFPLFRPELAKHCDGFSTLGTLKWPANVLLIGTEADEAHELAALPIPPSTWGYAAHVPVTLRTHRSSSDTTAAEPALNEVAIPQWQQWQVSSADPGSLYQEIGEIISELESCFPLSRTAAQRMLRCATLSERISGVKQSDIVAMWLARQIVDLGLDDARGVLEDLGAWPEEIMTGADRCARR